MKKLFLIPVFQVIMFLALQAQPVSNYSYKFDNGINVKSDHTWSQVWVQQTYSPLKSGDLTPLAVNMRTLGDLIAGSTFSLISKGKEVKMKGAAPGTYDLKMSFKLSGKPGTLGFVVGNVVIKPQTKTNVDVTLYDYQVMIDEAPLAGSATSSFESFVQRCKSSTISENLSATPAFYTKEDHKTAVNPDEGAGKAKGKIKPGTYDVLLTIGLPGQNQRVWLENFQMKPGTSYKITTNLNAGGVIYAGGNKEVKALHLYPAGTADKQAGTPAPVKNLEIISYKDVSAINCCTPGVFDVLLDMGNGKRYEWRKNIAVKTGSKTEIR